MNHFFNQNSNNKQSYFQYQNPNHFKEDREVHFQDRKSNQFNQNPYPQNNPFAYPQDDEDSSSFDDLADAIIETKVGRQNNNRHLTTESQKRVTLGLDATDYKMTPTRDLNMSSERLNGWNSRNAMTDHKSMKTLSEIGSMQDDSESGSLLSETNPFGENEKKKRKFAELKREFQYEARDNSKIPAWKMVKTSEEMYRDELESVELDQIHKMNFTEAHVKVLNTTQYTNNLMINEQNRITKRTEAFDVRQKNLLRLKVAQSTF